MKTKSWEKNWKNLVKVNFDGLNGNAYGKGEIEMKVEMLGLIFIRQVREQARQEGIEEGKKEVRTEIGVLMGEYRERLEPPFCSISEENVRKIEMVIAQVLSINSLN